MYNLFHFEQNNGEYTSTQMYGQSYGVFWIYGMFVSVSFNSKKLQLYTKKASIGEIVTDDDTTMRANIKHKGGKSKITC